MANKELVDYIHRSMSHGGTLTHIKQHLDESGWPESEINEAIHEATQVHRTHEKPKKKRSGLMMFAAVVILLLIASIFLYFIFVDESTPGTDEGPVDCGVDSSCFISKLVNCDLATFTSGLGPYIQFDISVTGMEDDKCIIHYLATENPMPVFKDTEMDCKLPKGEYTDESYESYFQENLANICQGTYIDAMRDLGVENI